MSSEGSALTAGTLLDHYRIEAPLGSGGMGEVYRAHDLRLGRDVAVKILPASFSRDPERRARFEREARVLASLSHPNLLAVLDVGEEGDILYTVTELLEGKTLRETLAGGPLPVEEACRIGLQLCRGLGAAHARGVVHRDLKPENVLVSPEGHAKILDFGLATSPAPWATDSEQETGPPAARTSPGALLGTCRYMSPEQLRGEPADRRADLFALGLVLFEMLTGRHAFERPAAPETVAAILKDAPGDLAALAQGVPPAVASAVSRCLAKRPDERFSDASEVAQALRAASAQAPTRRRLSPVVWAAGGLLAATLLTAWGLHALSDHGAAPSLPAFTPRQITTASGVQRQPALSPDGRTVAYVVDGASGSDLWVSDAGGGPPLRLTSDGASNEAPAWFPDGGSLVFCSQRAGKAPALWKVSRFGGPPTLLLEDAQCPSVSPDGGRLAFCRAGGDGFLRVGVADAGDPHSAHLLTSRLDGVWDHLNPAWSPDGKALCYQDHNDLWIVPAEGGTARPLTRDDAPDYSPAWSPDGRHVYFQSLREGTTALWRVEVDSGRLERVTLGTGAEGSPTLSADGRRLAYATFLDRSALVVVDRATGRRTDLRPGRECYEPDLAPDGSALVFSSNREGSFDLWKVALAGGEAEGDPQKLTPGRGSCAHPAFSPDGRWIAFHRLEEGRRSVWVIPASGGEPERVSLGEATDVFPEWSPRGDRLAFLSNRGGTSQVWTVPLRDGRPEGPARALTDLPDGIVSFAWAPDASALACVVLVNGGGDLWLCPLAPGAAPRRLTHRGDVSFVSWDRANNRLLVTAGHEGRRMRLFALSPRDGSGGILAEALPGDAAADVLDASATPDGRWLVFFEQMAQGNVWVLETRDGTF